MTANWGIKDHNPRDFDRVDYLVIDRAMVPDDPYKDLLRRIEKSPWVHARVRAVRRRGAEAPGRRLSGLNPPPPPNSTF